METPKSSTRLYKIWVGIKQRCYNPNCRIYYKYGAKGIIMSNDWLSFENFKAWAEKAGYKENLTIDRIDSNGVYAPENCRWATYEQQNTHLRMLSTNKSGYIGISWSKKEHKWISSISIKNKTVRIGCYNAQKEAAEARNNYIDTHNLPHQKVIYVGEKSKGEELCTR